MAIALLLGSMGACAGATADLPAPPGKIAVVVAHSDDETAFGGVIARYARESEVHLVIATDGRYGVSAHAGIPTGNSLVLVRAEEARYSAERLGITETAPARRL